MNPIETLLPRLSEVRHAARGDNQAAWRSACPVCQARGQPLSLAISSSGLPLLNCLAHHCQPDEILGTVGLAWADILPPRPLFHRARGNGGPAAWASLAAAIDALMDAHCRLLGACSPAMHTHEIEAALRAIIDCGEGMEHVRKMARRAMREAK